MSDKPVVLFACIHNSGRSVAARVLTEHYAKGALEARSAGSEPKDSVNPVVAEVLADRGLSTAAEKPTKLDPVFRNHGVHAEAAADDPGTDGVLRSAG